MEKLRSISITMIVAMLALAALLSLLGHLLDDEGEKIANKLFGWTVYVLLLLVLISPLAALSLILTEVSVLLRRYDQFDWRKALRSMMFAILGLVSPYFIFLHSCPNYG